MEGAQVTEEGASSSASQTLAADVISGGRARTAGGSQPELGHKPATGSQPGGCGRGDPRQGHHHDAGRRRLPVGAAHRDGRARGASRFHPRRDRRHAHRRRRGVRHAAQPGDPWQRPEVRLRARPGLDDRLACRSAALPPRVPADDTFAWTVLTALAGNVDARVGPGDVLTIALRKSRDSSRSV